MKKSFILSAAAALTLLVSCGTSADIASLGQPDPALTGTWVSRHETNDKNGKREHYDRVSFFSDGTFAQYGYIKMEMKESGTPAHIEISFQGSGKYGVTNDNINFCFSPSDRTAKLDRFDVSTDKTLSAHQAGATKFILKSVLIKPLIKDMRKSMKEGQIYHIDSITTSTLDMTDLKDEEHKSETYLKQNGNE